MTRELSKKLCEIAGIKPRYGVYVNFGDLDYNYRLVTNERKYRLIADYRYRVDDEDELRGLQAVYYPDFGEPENFVKLMELKIPDGTKNTILSYFIKIMLLKYGLKGCVYNRKEFLFFLLNILTENIKQAIREAGWKYE